MKLFFFLFIILLQLSLFSQTEEQNISVSYTDEVLKVTYNPLWLKDSIDYVLNINDQENLELIFRTKNKNLKTYIFSSLKDTNFIYYIDQNSNIIRKPILYIYSPQKQTLTLQIIFNGTIKNTYPQYNKNWQIQADKQGILTNIEDNKKYRYLFWDGQPQKQYKIENFKEGFIVGREQVLGFIDSILTLCGFNEFEKNDFISYWLPYLSDHDKIFIHFFVNEQCNEIAKYNCNKKIDTFLRLYMFFAPIENTISVVPQQINRQHPKGLTIVEWGGMQINQ